MIVTFDYIKRNRKKLGRIIATSGGYDPLHPGHISCFEQSKAIGGTFVVIVNGDSFLNAKKGKRFMRLKDRCKVMDALAVVDYVIPFEIKNDTTVIKALEELRPDIFTKGGDRRDARTIAEWDICQELGIEIRTRIGDKKKWSSSILLTDWADWYMSKALNSTSLLRLK